MIFITELSISISVNIPIRKNCEEDDVGTNSARVNTYVRISSGTENERRNKPTLKRWRLVYISRPRNREKENELFTIVRRSFTVSTLDTCSIRIGFPRLLSDQPPQFFTVDTLFRV